MWLRGKKSKLHRKKMAHQIQNNSKWERPAEQPKKKTMCRQQTDKNKCKPVKIQKKLFNDWMFARIRTRSLALDHNSKFICLFFFALQFVRWNTHIMPKVKTHFARAFNHMYCMDKDKSKKCDKIKNSKKKDTKKLEWDWVWQQQQQKNFNTKI